MTYSEKLQDPRWQKKSAEIKIRDDWRCKICESGTAQLHVHHLKYDRGLEPWDYPDDRLVTLCKPCHSRMESRTLLLAYKLCVSAPLPMVEDVIQSLLTARKKLGFNDGYSWLKTSADLADNSGVYEEGNFNQADASW